MKGKNVLVVLLGVIGFAGICYASFTGGSLLADYMLSQESEFAIEAPENSLDEGIKNQINKNNSPEVIHKRKVRMLKYDIKSCFERATWCDNIERTLKENPDLREFAENYAKEEGYVKQ